MFWLHGHGNRYPLGVRRLGSLQTVILQGGHWGLVGKRRFHWEALGSELTNGDSTVFFFACHANLESIFLGTFITSFFAAKRTGNLFFTQAIVHVFLLLLQGRHCANPLPRPRLLPDNRAHSSFNPSACETWPPCCCAIFWKKSLQIMFYAFPDKKVVEVCEFSW